MAEPDKGVPQVGMVFKDREEAWLFWLAYGGRVGFDVRKRYANKSPMDGKITSCRYVCSKEGLQKKGQRESIQKCCRAETRTECKAFMSLTLNRVSGNFEVCEVDLQHNHLIYLPQTRHLMVSRRKISDFQAFEIEAADDSGIMPKAAYEFASFKWLFDSFLATHNGRQPRTIYTDQDAAIGKAVDVVFTEAYHGLCTFHIMQNVVKHLSPIKGDANDEGEEQDGGEEEDKEPHILTDFGACMYGYEDKEAFEEAFAKMRLKVRKQTWLDNIYKFKEKWAECFMRHVFSLGVRSTQLSESFNNSLKNHLKSDFHIVRFLKHFDRTVEDKRNKELESEFEARKNIPRIKMRTPMLVQASQVYTPIIFEAFQGEYERSITACTKVLDGNNYVVSIGVLHGDLTFEDERIVIGDPLNKTATCSCGMFERTGILCGHGLKVLDLMNIKTLPTHYILKRWTREARKGSILDKQGRNVVENPKLEAMLRYKELSHKFHSMAYKIAYSPECCLLLENALDCVRPQLEEKLNAQTSAMKDPSNDQLDENVDPNVQQNEDFLRAARLKKKEVQSKNLRRKKSWLDKLLKGKRKATKPVVSIQRGAKQSKKKDDIQPQVQVEDDSRKKEDNVDNEKYNVIESFTQLLTTPTCDGGSFYDENLF